MLAHIRGDVGVGILGHVPQGFDHVLRLDHLAGAHAELQAVAAAPAFDGAPPAAQGIGIGLGTGFLDHRDQLGQHFFHVANDGHIDLDALGNARRVDVDMDDLAFVLREMLGIADHAVIKAGTYGQQHVAVLHRVVGFDGAVHAQHAQEFFVAGRVSAQAHQGIGAGVAQHVHQGAQFLRGVAQQDTAAGVDVGALGGQQQLQGLADLAAVAFAHRVVRAHADGFGVAVESGLLERHVFRNIYHHRAGATGAGNVECFFQRLGQVAHVFHQKVVLDHGPGDTHGIAFLESIQANGVCRHLAADDHHGDAVHVRGGNAGNGIRQTRAGSDQRHTHITGSTGITVGGVHGCLLVAHQHMLDGVLFVERVVDVKNCTTGVTPDVLDVLGLEALHQNLGTHEFDGSGAQSTGCGGVGRGCCGCRSDFGFIDFHDEPL